MYEYTSFKSMNEPKKGFWGGLAQKAKSIIEDDNVAPRQFHNLNKMRPQKLHTSNDNQVEYRIEVNNIYMFMILHMDYFILIL